MGLISLILVALWGVAGAGAASLEGLLPPDGAELLAEALASPWYQREGTREAEGEPGLSATEAQLLGRVGSALDGATAGQRELFWDSVRRPQRVPTTVRQPAPPPVRRERRRTQQPVSPDPGVSRCATDTDSSDNLVPAHSRNLIIEADEASDLNLLITHVAKILLEDMMDYNVTLVPRENNVHGIQRIADKQVHANFDVGLEEPRDFQLYTDLVEIKEEVKDLGATGYSRTGGLFVANAHKLSDVPGQCLYQDFWQTYTSPAVQDKMLSVHDIDGGMDTDGAPLCDESAGIGFCAAGVNKYFSTSACDPEGYAVDIPCGAIDATVDADVTMCGVVDSSAACEGAGRCSAGDTIVTSSECATAGGTWATSPRCTRRPCRAILAHYPTYEPAVNEQLVNNLGEEGFAFGLVWLGRHATEIIRRRAAAGDVFLFHHWYPSTLLQSGNHTWLDLPTHQREQWLSNASDLPDGPIASAYAPTAVVKLLNSEVMEENPTVMEFMESFEMHEQQVESLVSHSWEIEKQYNCTGIDESEQCMQVHRDSACAWIQNNPQQWEYFLPAHKHCPAGQRVSTDFEEFTSRCVPCAPGTFMDHPSNLHRCKDCPSGQFQSGYSATECETCHIGKYSPITGAVSSDNCTACESGQHQASPGATECIPCGMGEYQNASGMPFCNPCSTGEYQPATASVECLACPANELACSVEISPEGALQEKCLDKRADRSSCTCDPGTFRSVADSCEPNPDVDANTTTAARSRCVAFSRSTEWGTNAAENKALCLKDSSAPYGSPWWRFWDKVPPSRIAVHGDYQPACVYIPKGSCRPCPEGAHCCMCAEVAGCYDSSYGACNETLLFENLQLCNSTCCDRSTLLADPLDDPRVNEGLCNDEDRLPPEIGRENIYDGVSEAGRGLCPLWAPSSPSKDNEGNPNANRLKMTATKCWSGSNRPLAMQGHFGVELEDRISQKPGDNGVMQTDPVFLACNLRLATTRLRTAVTWDYQPCWGGPNNTCACVDDRRDPELNGIFAYSVSSPTVNSTKCNTGFLCGAKCPDGYYRSFTEACKPCNNPGFSSSLLQGVFHLVFWLMIPLIFNGFYFSVSDKTAAQYMVYPRMLIDLVVVLYLVYKSLFRYWPRELLNFPRTDGHSKSEGLNSLFMECAFGWNFETRYYTYLCLPFVLVLGILLQVTFVWFVFTFDNTLYLIDGSETEDALVWKRMLLRLPTSERKAAITSRSRAEKGEATAVEKRDYEEWQAKARTQAEDDEASDNEEASKGSCLNSIARSLGRSLPDSSTARGSRIAIAPPKDNDGWDRFTNHAVQVLLLLCLMIYVTMVNYSLTIFDCSNANDHWQLGGPQLASPDPAITPRVTDQSILVGWGEQPAWASDPDRRGQNMAVWGASGGFVEEEPTIACDWRDKTWRRLAIFGTCAFIGYTVAIPGTLLYVFMANKEAARRGDMSYMQRYGFLLKPYKQDMYFWEIVNVARKGFLSCLVRLTSDSPFMCASASFVALAFLVSHQARFRPYKYDKHNNCAIAVLSCGVLNFFSSMIFISNVASLRANQALLAVNGIAWLAIFFWAFFGFVKDAMMFLRLTLFSIQCEAVGRAEEEREEFWLRVDRPGLIQLMWYDALVVRNRYSHVVYREERLSADDPPQPENSSNEKRGRVWVEGKPVRTKFIRDDQNSAHANWVNFHEGFAKFVAGISKERVAEQYLRDLENRDSGDARAEGGTFDNPEVSTSPSRDGIAEVRSDFQHLESSVKLLEQLYSARNLSYMVLYMEYAIKHDLTRKFKLDKLGPSDIASHILQFTRIFAEELVTGDNGGVGGGGDDGMNAFNGLNDGVQVEAGGWQNAEDTNRQSSMVAATTSSAATSFSGIAEEEQGTGSRESSAERLKAARRKAGVRDDEKQEYASDSNGLFFFRPHRVMGIDMKPYHEAKGLEREVLHADRTGTAMDFANPLHACAPPPPHPPTHILAFPCVSVV